MSKQTIDGEVYAFRKMPAMAALRLDGLCVRLLGPALFPALMASEGLPELLARLGEFLGTLGEAEDREAALDEALTKDVGELLKTQLGPLISSVSTAVELLGDRLTDRDLEQIVELVVLGCVAWVDKDDGERTELDSLKTYNSIVGDAMGEHGHFHQLKLIWAALKFQLGPSTAGAHGDRPAKAKAAAASG